MWHRRQAWPAYRFLPAAGLVLLLFAPPHAAWAGDDWQDGLAPGPLPTHVRSLYASFRTEATAPREAGLLYMNSLRIGLACEFRGVGPSGVSRVEVWGTRDGQTWQKYGEQTNPRPPFVVEVPEEGRYGFTLVVYNGAGIGRPSPRPGEPPQYWVEVDVTPPTVALQDVVVGRGRDAGTVAIHWEVADTNLGSRPIRLAYAERPEGPWKVFQAGLTNTGRYVWKTSPQTPYRVYVRLEATDLAGNQAFAQSDKPVVIDVAEPQAVIIGAQRARD